MQTLYHGSRVEVKQPEIRVQRFHKDFFWGFYCTKIEVQASRWATKFGTTGIVNVYSFDDQANLQVLFIIWIKVFYEVYDLQIFSLILWVA